MADRPCRPNADLKRIWQLLLPETPFPACGMEENAEADDGAARPAREDAETQRNLRRA